MKHYSFIFFLILSLLVSSLFLPTVFAVGFSNLPSQREYNFVPGLTVDIPIYPSNANTIRVVFGAPTGDLATLGTSEDDNIANYVTLEDPSPDGPPREVILHMRFPEQLKPGDYFIGVVAQDVQIGEGTVSAIASTSLRFTIHVLSPTKRIDILETRTYPIPEGLNANVSVFVVSRTSQNIDRMFSEVRVYKNGELVSTANSPTISLASGEPAELVTKLNTEDLKGGEYQVNATVHFDEFVKNAPTTEILKIGTLHVGLEDYTRTFTYNTTNQFLFNISNQWNRELQDAYTEVHIGSQFKKSASQNIAPFKNTQYELYFDREEAIKANTTIIGNVTVTFKDFDPATKTYVAKQETFNATIDIVLPPVVEKKWWEGDTLIYVIIGGIALIVMLILVLIIVLLYKKTSKPPSVASSQLSKPVAVVESPKVTIDPKLQEPVVKKPAEEDWKPPKN